MNLCKICDRNSILNRLEMLTFCANYIQDGADFQAFQSHGR